MSGVGCIYLITNLINNKKYIGQYKEPDPRRRFAIHLRNAKNGLKFAIYAAIRKYGKENFSIERLAVCPLKSLGNMEAYYAEQLETYIWDNMWDNIWHKSPGYNMVWCGHAPRLGITHTQDVREQLRKSHTGKRASEETRKRISEAHKGMKRSVECCKNIKEGKKNNPISSEALQKLIALNTGRKMSDIAREKMKAGHARAKELKLANPDQTPIDMPKFKCTYPLCTKEVSSRSSLKLHMRTHTNEKPFACKLCDKAFACGSNLDQHVLIHKTVPVTCDCCGKVYKNTNSLRNHKYKSHRKMDA